MITLLLLFVLLFAGCIVIPILIAIALCLDAVMVVMTILVPILWVLKKLGLIKPETLEKMVKARKTTQKKVSPKI